MNQKTIKLLWLRESFPWMGSHSGYELLCDIIQDSLASKCHSVYKSDLPFPRLTERFLQPITEKVKQSLTYDQASTKVEIETLWKTFLVKPDIVHTVYVERCLGLLPQWKNRLDFKLVGTAHQPSGLWRLGRHNPELILQLDALIVLSSREISFFESYLPGRVHLILHGVDTNFFSPVVEPVKPSAPRYVFSGTWLRDLDTLASVIETTIARDPGIQFDLIVPASKRHHPQFYRISRYNQIHWHGGLSDIQLREVYRRATALLLPLLDCTANNALLEGIACGLPVISNDVGGMNDYTRPSFARLLPTGDTDGFVETILTLANDSEETKKKGQLARAFAESDLAWPVIARQTRMLYEKVAFQ